MRCDAKYDGLGEEREREKDRERKTKRETERERQRGERGFGKPNPILPRLHLSTS